MSTSLETVLAVLDEQIAGLTASAATFDAQRASSLAAAEAASVNKSGVLARAAELQAARDELAASLPTPE